MSEKFKGQYSGVSYGRILGAPGVIRNEFEALASDIEGTPSGRHFLNQNPLDDMRNTWVFRCEQAAKLEKGLREQDLRTDLADRVSGIREYFNNTVKFAGYVSSLSSYEEFMNFLNQIQSGDNPVLPDIGVINAGVRFCKTYGQFQDLYALILKLEMKPDCKFFNAWLGVCYSSASEVIWVCEKAREAGYTDLNHESRTVFCGLFRGSSGRQLCQTLSVPEMLRLKDWIVKNRIQSGGGKIWSYIVDELIAPVTRGTDSHFAAIHVSYAPAIHDGGSCTARDAASPSGTTEVMNLYKGVVRRRRTDS